MKKMAGSPPVKFLFLVLTVWAISSLLFSAGDFAQFLSEERRLRKVLSEIGVEGMDRREAARAIQSAVRSRVTAVPKKGKFYDVADRPALRHTAVETWTHAEGQCGEGARLIVNLLLANGIEASRINLSNEKTQFYHTAVAYQAEGKWWLLDSINSPEGFPEWASANNKPMSELVRVEMHPGGALLVQPDNPFFARYSFFSWARIFGDKFEVNQFVGMPRFVVYITEKPPLLKALLKCTACLGLAICIVFVGLIFKLVKNRRV